MMKIVVGLLIAVSCFGAVPVIYDDDCTSDADCALASLPALFKLADRGEIQILGVMADSANMQASAALCAFASYYGYATISGGTCASGISISAYQGSLSCSTGCNTSAWLSSLVGQFDSGDTRANYPSCITAYRTILAANSGVTIIETGMMTCLNGLLTSSADGISSYTGAQLIQMNVSKIVILGGINPSGTEFNMQSDPSDASNFFSTVTSQNSYPPIWMIGNGNGTGTNAGPPQYGITTVNPAYYVANQDSANQRPVWDALAILYAARGLSYGGTTYFSDAGNGTQTVNASTGANSWSTGTASGQHYLANVASTTVLSDVFDGYAYGFGFSALGPGVGSGTYSHGNVKFTGTVH
jgi:inosine-uridine nucleoside N-ribohydrolase